MRAPLPINSSPDMGLLQTVLAFLVTLGVLIVFHELGHYLVARLCGVKVLRFSVGMGRVIFSRRFGPDQTEWALSVFPIGGYVKMLDVREQPSQDIPLQDLPREFTGQPVWKRMAIVIAGPLANFLLAIVLLTCLFMTGVPEPSTRLRQPMASTLASQLGLHGEDMIVSVNGKSVQAWSALQWEVMQSALDHQSAQFGIRPNGSSTPYQMTFPLDQLSEQDLQGDFLGKLGLGMWMSPARLGTLMPDSPALRAGMRKGDVVVAIDGQPVRDNVDLVTMVRAAPGKPLQISANRDGTILEFLVTPLVVPAEQGTIGRLNVEVQSKPDLIDHREDFLTALSGATARTWDTSVLTLKMLGRMLIGEASVKNITGPLTIADYAGQSAKSGWTGYLSFLAFVSISLGIMNLLPVPILDGGHLLYYSLEVLTGRPVSARIWEMSQRAGLAILLSLMVIALFNDIVRLLPS